MQIDGTIEKSSSFPELEIIELALNQVNEYYTRKTSEYRQQKVTDKNFNYDRAMSDLKKRKEISNKMVEQIKKAMSDYEMAARSLSEYENQKIQGMLKSLNDQKLIKVYEKEIEQIRKTKMIAKRDLINALSAQNLKFIETYLQIENNDVDKVYETSAPYMVDASQNLNKIIEKLDGRDNKEEIIASQFIDRTESSQVHGKNVYQQKDIEKRVEDQNAKYVDTLGSGIFVSDPELKETDQFNSLEDDQKNTQIQEFLGQIEPMIGEIDVILNSSFKLNSKEQKMLEITKEEYQKLSNINLEYKRIEATIKFLKETNSPASLSKTHELLTKYAKKLLEQQREQLKKTQNSAVKSKLNDYVQRARREEGIQKLQDSVDYYERKTDAARDEAEKNYYEGKTQEYKDDYMKEMEAPLDEYMQQPTGRSR